MSDLLELAARAEAATGPDASLDCEIHRALFGGKQGRELGFAPILAEVWYYTDPETGHALPSPFRFTMHVEEAEKALPGPESPEYQITRRYCTGYHASIGTGNDGVGCETAALALLSAALRAHAEPASLTLSKQMEG